MTEITYALAGLTPDDWWNIEVIDLETGLPVRDVLEVDTASGWLIRRVRNDEGDPVLNSRGWQTQYLKGRF